VRIHPYDLAIVVIYLAGVTWFGARFRRGQTGLRDYFLGGQSAPWWALGISIVATETSTLTLIGTPAIGFAGNLAFLQIVMGYLVGRAILCVYFVPQYFRGRFFTAYELIERWFGVRARRLAAVIFLATRVLAEGVRMAAIGKVVSVALGYGDRLSIAIITLLTVFYTFQGGMKAVIWTDVIQFCMAAGGGLAAFWFLLHRIPGGWHEVAVTAAAAGGKLRVFDFSLSLTKSYTFWTGLFGGTFLTLASHGSDQTIVQRILAARNQRDAKAALLASGVLVFLQFTLFLLIGVMLFVFTQHTALPAAGHDADRIFPEFIVTQMPAGLCGLVLASIFGIAMSNASGSLNALASSTVIDFSWGAAYEGSGRLLKRSRLVTIFWGIVLGLFGLVHWGPVLEAGLTIASITYGSLLGVFLLGMINRRATEAGAMTGMIAGLFAMMAVHWLTPLAWTWYVLAGSLITFFAASLASLGGSRRARRNSSPVAS
jgi:solute:Na+ symporter, SSS family